ncbi:streptamidine family RiPP [Nocardiopsis sp. YSL2]|uniref:streptamidine family RiPP n=1 Tax=Nocardiopsis sp. YSL2 TaxID=2939492 RepID=UPI0026F47A74|nr:streptamidine family RiPP [Nocardiopsis sp. YSL2]
MDNQIVAEIEQPEQLAHLSATHSNALVENPFDVVAEIEESEQLAHLSATHSNALVENPFD